MKTNDPYWDVFHANRTPAEDRFEKVMIVGMIIVVAVSFSCLFIGAFLRLI